MSEFGVLGGESKSGIVGEQTRSDLVTGGIDGLEGVITLLAKEGWHVTHTNVLEWVTDNKGEYTRASRILVVSTRWTSYDANEKEE